MGLDLQTGVRIQYWVHRLVSQSLCAFPCDPGLDRSAGTTAEAPTLGLAEEGEDRWHPRALLGPAAQSGLFLTTLSLSPFPELESCGLGPL